MERTKRGWVLIGIMFWTISCQNKSAENVPDAEAARTPVTVATVTYAPLNDSIELNATSAFLQNNYVKANSTGYIRSVDAKPGEYIGNGKVLFTLETKEASVIGHSISSLDSSFKFNGLTTIRSTGHGYLTQLNHQQGDYVQDGEQLAVISDMNS
ncbi:MAG TPA: hypothetical protein VK543_05195, partial [Puia sp.]|nr:hypothetical protein [Puia sp.]